MTSPWQPIDPGPNDLKELPFWAKHDAATAIGITVSVVVSYMRWPGKEFFASDTTNVMRFAIEWVLIAIPFMFIYCLAVILGTLYEKYPGQTTIDPEAGNICLTAVTAPILPAAVFVGVYLSAPLTLILILFWAAISKWRQSRSV